MPAQKFACAILILLSVAPAAAFQNFSSVSEQWQLELGTDGFFTHANYLGDSTQQILLPSHIYNNYGTFLHGSYNLDHEWSILGTIDSAYAHSDDGSSARNAYNVSDAGIGLQYLRRYTWIWLAPEFSASYAFNPVEVNTDTVLVGEGAATISGILNALKIWTHAIQSYGYLGYTYRFDGRSSLLPFDFGSKFRLIKPWFGAEIRGYRTAFEDEDTNSPSMRTSVTDRVDAGSLRYYSINPSLVEGEIFTEIFFNPKLMARLAGNVTLWGQNTAQGYGYFFSLKYAFGGNPQDQDAVQISHREYKKRSLEEKKVREFKSKPEQEDKSLFPEDPD